jgi:hypothetical protein
VAFVGVVFGLVVGAATLLALPRRPRRSSDRGASEPLDISVTPRKRGTRRRARHNRHVIARSILLFLLAALAEIGGAWLVWQGVREHRGWIWIGAGIVALGAYGFVATLKPDAHFGCILAAYGGVFRRIAGLGHGPGRLPARPLPSHRGADLPGRWE